MGDREERHEEEICIPRNEQEYEEEEYTFPIRECDEEDKMKNIILQFFHYFMGYL